MHCSMIDNIFASFGSLSIKTFLIRKIEFSSDAQFTQFAFNLIALCSAGNQYDAWIWIGVFCLLLLASAASFYCDWSIPRGEKCHSPKFTIVSLEKIEKQSEKIRKSCKTLD